MYNMSSKIITLLICLCTIILWSCESEQPFDTDNTDNTGGYNDDGSFDDWNDPQSSRYKPGGYYPIESGTWIKTFGEGPFYLKFLKEKNVVKTGIFNLYLQAEDYQYSRLYQINNSRLYIDINGIKDVGYKLVTEGDKKTLELYAEWGLKSVYEYEKPLYRYDDLKYVGEIGVANSIGEVSVISIGGPNNNPYVKKTEKYTVKDRTVYLNRNMQADRYPSLKYTFYPEYLSDWRMEFLDSKEGKYSFNLRYYLSGIPKEDRLSWNIAFYSRLATPSIFGFSDLAVSGYTGEEGVIRAEDGTVKTTLKDGKLTIELNKFKSYISISTMGYSITGTFVITFNEDIAEALRNPLY